MRRSVNLQGDIESVRKFHRDPLFDRTLQELRAKGGYATVAAAKAEEFIELLSGNGDSSGRHKFRFTRKGEYRIRNCRKVDLGCGYRIICIQKDQRLVLMYIGTHDDSFRWIDRHRTAEYDLDAIAGDAWIPVAVPAETQHRHDNVVTDEDRFAEAYEEALLSRVDDAVLRNVFAGVVNGRV
jgi:hypothetical protein